MKPQPKRVPSDACEVIIDGEVCRPHEGEAVYLISSETVGETRLRVRFAQMLDELEAVKGDKDAFARSNAILDRHYAELIEHLAERVFSWDWTDLRGRPLPPPVGDDGKALGLLRLRAPELYWLMNAVAPQETEDERKNA